MPERVPPFRPIRLRTRPREEHRPNAHQRGYCDKAHRRWRQAVLTRDAWTCVACGRVCTDRREAHADHIVPVAAGGDRYALSNGQTLCVRCHGRKTRAETVAKCNGGGAVGIMPPNP